MIAMISKSIIFTGCLLVESTCFFFFPATTERYVIDRAPIEGAPTGNVNEELVYLLENIPGRDLVFLSISSPYSLQRVAPSIFATLAIDF